MDAQTARTTVRSMCLGFRGRSVPACTRWRERRIPSIHQCAPSQMDAGTREVPCFHDSGTAVALVLSHGRIHVQSVHACSRGPTRSEVMSLPSYGASFMQQGRGSASGSCERALFGLDGPRRICARFPVSPDESQELPHNFQPSVCPPMGARTRDTGRSTCLAPMTPARSSWCFSLRTAA